MNMRLVILLLWFHLRFCSSTRVAGDIGCKLSAKGGNYLGKQNYTQTGLQCQRWDTNSVHVSYDFQDDAFAERNRTLAENYCRNPYYSASLWCYTMDPAIRFEYCDVPFCETEAQQLITTDEQGRLLYLAAVQNSQSKWEVTLNVCSEEEKYVTSEQMFQLNSVSSLYHLQSGLCFCVNEITEGEEYTVYLCLCYASRDFWHLETGSQSDEIYIRHSRLDWCLGLQQPKEEDGAVLNPLRLLNCSFVRPWYGVPLAGVVASVDTHYCDIDTLGPYHHLLDANKSFSRHLCQVTYFRAPSVGDYSFSVEYYDESPAGEPSHPGIVWNWLDEYNLETFYARSHTATLSYRTIVGGQGFQFHRINSLVSPHHQWQKLKVEVSETETKLYFNDLELVSRPQNLSRGWLGAGVHHGFSSRIQYRNPKLTLSKRYCLAPPVLIESNCTQMTLWPTGTVCHVTCQRGHLNLGDSITECQEYGEWSWDVYGAPYCVPYFTLGHGVQALPNIDAQLNDGDTIIIPDPGAYIPDPGFLFRLELYGIDLSVKVQVWRPLADDHIYQRIWSFTVTTGSRDKSVWNHKRILAGDVIALKYSGRHALVLKNARDELGTKYRFRDMGECRIYPLRIYYWTQDPREILHGGLIRQTSSYEVTPESNIAVIPSSKLAFTRDGILRGWTYRSLLLAEGAQFELHIWRPTSTLGLYQLVHRTLAKVADYKLHHLRLKPSDYVAVKKGDVVGLQVFDIHPVIGVDTEACYEEAYRYTHRTSVLFTAGQRVVFTNTEVVCKTYSVKANVWYPDAVVQSDLAVGRPATQSSTANKWGLAGYAVDRSMNTLTDHTCTATDVSTDPWWMVQLPREYLIDKVTLTASADAASYPQDLYIGTRRVSADVEPPNVGNMKVCASHSGVMDSGDTYVFTCTGGGVRGRYLAVVQSGEGRALALCQIQVYEARCPPGYTWRPLLQTCHQFRPHPANQTTATAMCADTGGTLVSIETPAEQSYVESYTNSLSEVNLAGQQRLYYTAGSWFPETAVDRLYGVRYYPSYECFHTFATNVNAWWTVDLGRMYTITSVRILNRGDCCADRLTDLRLGMLSTDSAVDGLLDTTLAENIEGFSVCVSLFTGSVAGGAWLDLTCESGSRGRYFTIQKSSISHLQLCEVELYSSASLLITSGVQVDDGFAWSATGASLEDDYLYFSPLNAMSVGVSGCVVIDRRQGFYWTVQTPCDDDVVSDVVVCEAGFSDAVPYPFLLSSVYLKCTQEKACLYSNLDFGICEMDKLSQHGLWLRHNGQLVNIASGLCLYVVDNLDPELIFAACGDVRSRVWSALHPFYGQDSLVQLYHRLYTKCLALDADLNLTLDTCNTTGDLQQDFIAEDLWSLKREQFENFTLITCIKTEYLSGDWLPKLNYTNQSDCLLHCNRSGMFYGYLLAEMCWCGASVMDLVSVAFTKCEDSQDGTYAFVYETGQLVRCSDPPTEPHGRYQDPVCYSSNIHNGSVCTLVCDTGYQLDGHASFQCMDSGLWNESTTPSCSAVPCQPPPIEHVSWSPPCDRDPVYMDQCHVTCHMGYRLVNDSINNFTCDAVGELNYTGQPSCENIWCQSPHSIEGTDLNTNGLTEFVFGATVNYKCLHGYQYHGGDTVRFCNAQGNWSGTDLNCSVITCPDPEPVLHAEGLPTDLEPYIYHSVLVYSCQAGFDRASGDSQLICGEQGLWEGEYPVCERINCSTLPEVPSADTNVSGLSYQSVVTYTCLHGYKHTSGNLTRHCLETKSWNGTAPTCEEMTCGNPPSVNNTEMLYTGSNPGDTADYRCNRGYKSVSGNSSTLRCSSQEAWEGQLLQCTELSCPEEVPHIENADSVISGTFLGAKATYICDPDFVRLTGSIAITCQENEEWESLSLVCTVVDCGVPDDVSNAVKHYSSTVVHSVVTYMCQPGHESLPSSATAVCGRGGDWSEISLECVAITCAAVEYAMYHSEVSSGGSRLLSFQASVSLQCRAGYREVSGSRVRVCNEDRQWTGSPLVCEEILCPEPPAMDSGHFQVFSYKPGGVAFYTCDMGYSLVSSAELACLKSGQWSSLTPTCQKIHCADINTPKEGPLLQMGRDFSYGSIVEFTCHHGYSIANQNILQCLETGKWNSTIPQCTVLSCPRPPSVANSTHTYTGSVHGSEVAYLCGRGFKMSEGDGQLTCDSGRWLGSLPICQVIECPPPLVTPSTTLTMTEVTVGSSVYYSCKEGYTPPSGDSMHITCLENSTWSGLPLECHKITCLDPPSVNLTSLRLDKESLQQTAIYRCLPGYSNPSNASLTKVCLANGQWSGGTLECYYDESLLEIVVPEDPPPTTSQERMMASIGMKRVDVQTSNMSTGAVLGGFFIVFTIAIIITMDLVSIKKDLRTLRQKCRTLCRRQR